MEAYWLNVGSLLFGLVAWGIPIFSLMKPKKGHIRSDVLTYIISLSACAISLCMQIFYTGHLVNRGDWTALMDTSQAVEFASFTLIAVTILLNVGMYALSCKKENT